MARWKIVVLIKKKCFVWCLSACSIVSNAGWFRFVRYPSSYRRENTFVSSLWMTEESFFSLLFLALMIVFYVLFALHSIHTPYTCRRSEKAKLFFTFTLFMRFSFSESVSEIFYVFLFTALLLKNWKMKMNTNFLHQVFQSFFSLFFVNRRKKVSVWIRMYDTRKKQAWRVQLLYVGAWVSKRPAAVDILNYTYVKINFNGNKYN